ncbi:isthmin-2-like [Ruditapes philippinarum]|uniref:isthmin-2-like n=1 Tax=Ruditapes philippinarum TaxID=129788 RepID=UPI00295BB788|nr:isthmin-2-like [Ruditapes philippinarum]
MRCVRNVTASAVSEEGNVEDGGQADDIERADTLSSATENLNPRKRRYKLFLKVLQKLNMCFLVIFIGYFAWTIAANYGHSGINSVSSWNTSNNQNVTIKTENSSSYTGNSRSIPFHSSSDDNLTDPPYQPNIVMPSHRKQAKRRRKKGRNRKRKHRKHRKTVYSSLEDYLNLTIERRKNRNAKMTCTDCKIRKRKGRRHKFTAGKISPSVLRRVLEKVADETLSGARTGTGTISSLYEEDKVRQDYDRDPDETGWSYDQHWVSISGGDTISQEDTVYKTDDKFSNRRTTPWTPWSPCSSSCGAGQQERMRKCGSACTEVESMVCVNPPCEGSSQEESSSTISEFYKWEKEGFVPPMTLPEQDYLDSNKDVCGKWVKCNKKFAQDFIKNSSLPACPCYFPLIRVKSKDIFDVELDKNVKWIDASSHGDLVYKPGAFACMRSSLVPGATTLAVQQCCYDSLYSLVTRGQAAGTPVLISPEISKELHHKVDLLPWIICKGDWTRYNQVLAPDNSLKCYQNPDDNIISWQRQQVGNY